MMQSLRVLSPAKVNLSLAVGPPLPSGYHPIRSVFQTISLYDVIWARPADSESVQFEGLNLEPGSTSVERMLRLLREVVEVPPLSWIIQKRIPDQSGLGGGSSDAAAVVHVLKELGVPGAGSPALWEVARAVGCDVPFFLVGGRCLVKGLGEVVQPLPVDAEQWFVIAQPEVKVSTAEAYRRLDDAGRLQQLPESDTLFRNDFEGVAPESCLMLKAQLEQSGAVGACLTGSGSAVMGVFECEQAASAAATSIGVPFVRVAKSVGPSGFLIERFAPDAWWRRARF